VAGSGLIKRDRPEAKLRGAHGDLPQAAADRSGVSWCGARFRNAMVEGPGGKQILLQDPSDNVIELFEPAQFTS